MLPLCILRILVYVILRWNDPYWWCFKPQSKAEVQDRATVVVYTLCPSGKINLKFSLFGKKYRLLQIHTFFV